MHVVKKPTPTEMPEYAAALSIPQTRLQRRASSVPRRCNQTRRIASRGVDLIDMTSARDGCVTASCANNALPVPPAYRFVAESVTHTYAEIVRRHAVRSEPTMVQFDKQLTACPLPLTFLSAPAKHAGCDFATLRASVEKALCVRADTPFVQVIGDCGTSFSKRGLCMGLRVVERYLSGKGAVLAYGVTASKGDANWIAGEYLRRHPDVRAIGNLVHESAEFILQRGCSVSPMVRHFVLTFHANGAPTMFGDDIDISDKIMSGDKGDIFVCLEGGPQSLQQSVNALLLDIPVIICHGLRDAAAGAGRFSAAVLLARLNSVATDGGCLTAAVETYVKECRISERHRCLIETWARKLIEEIDPGALCALIRIPAFN